MRPAPVFCVRELENRSIEVADQVADGVFVHAGERRSLGMPPDWNSAALPRDEEWRIEWSKFYFGLDLGHAFHATGHRRYLDAWTALVISWIDQVEVGADSSDVTGRRIQNWIYAWARFADCTTFPELAPSAERAMLTSLDAQIHWLADNLTRERNHRTLELYALLMGVLAFPHLDPNAALREFAFTQLNENLQRDVLDDGVQRERSTHYHMITLGSFLGAMENARRFGLALPEGFAHKVELAVEFAMHVHRPDGEIPMLSDSDGGSYTSLLARAAEIFARDDVRWVATAGAAGAAPERRSVSFPHGGYYIQRSDWGDGVRPFRDARYLVFDCGPLGDGGHGHYDALSIDAYAHGAPLIVDPGRYTYHEGAVNWRQYFKGTAAHNTVCVDGLDQTPYRRGKPKGAIATAEFLDRHTAPGLDVLSGRVTSPSYDAVHTRTVQFLHDRYWVVQDDLRGETPHHYDLRYHLSSEQTVQGVRRLGPATWRLETETMSLVIDGAQRVDIEDGWYAPVYGMRQRTTVISATRAATPMARFTTIVYPRSSSAILTGASTAWREDGKRSTIVDQQTWSGRKTDQVTVAPQPTAVANVDLPMRARVAFTRMDHAGCVESLSAADAAFTSDHPGKCDADREFPPPHTAWVTWERLVGWRWASVREGRQDVAGV